MKQLLLQFPFTGKIEWIGLRPKKRSDLLSVNSAEIVVAKGLIGDHYSGKNGKREVTLIQAEHIQAMQQWLNKEDLPPNLLRRNIVVSGINLLALKDQQIQIGNDVVLEITGLCHPCSRMEENLGKGGYNAMRGHGGVTAKVIKSGNIKLGDDLKFLHYLI
ncbi:MAG TPA: MOSC domain-containing protein [Candidatus Moranbacteria bacterium]|nr:MOSC domain-containing protein [Candidatus Moranbacteria bacterium]